MPTPPPNPSAPQRISETLEPKGCLSSTVVLVGGLGILVAIGLLVGLWVLSRQPQGLPGRKVRLSTLHLEPLVYAEEPVHLEDLQGKVVVLNFWGTWCPPCLMELPHLAQLYRKYQHEKAVVFLTVSCGLGPEEDPEQIRSDTSALLANQHLQLPTYLDPEWLTRRAVDQAVGFRGYPTTLLLDPQGYIRYIWVGFDPEMPHQLDQLVQELIAEKASG